MGNLLTAYGLTRTVEAWSKDPICAVSLEELQLRIAQGWLPETALTKPPRRKHARGKIRGVYWGEKEQKWLAKIKVKGKLIFVGAFDDQIEAARAWNRAAIHYRGTDAKLNKV